MPSRRAFVRGALAVAGAAAVGPGAWAQPGASALPLDNLGLEHFDTVVPDPAASARFYAQLFKTALHQQPLRDTLRYFVLLGDLPADRQVGYIAIGAAQGRPTAIGHYCTLAKVYDREGMVRALDAAGLPAARAAGPLAMWPDPDGLQLQLFQPPAGLVTAAVPSPLPVERAGVVAPRGLDHVLLQVSDLDRSLPYYRAVYGRGAEGPREGSPARVWFRLARETRIGLENASGGTPRIAHFAIKVAPFDRATVVARVQQLGAKVLPSPDEPDVLRFQDPDGIVGELRVSS
ncbi:MAG TPA: VOC family protein [Vicinamibacterales bacterium]|nr:VOC family protein [Vicinamibacterales bacterium]